jgi:GTPase
MRSGKLSLGDKLFIGLVNNEYIEATIRSVHDDDKNNVSFLRKDELGCIAIKLKDTSIIKSKEDIRAGMIITRNKLNFTKVFLSKINLFTTHSTTIKKGYNTIIHCCAVKKTVVVKEIFDSNMKELDYIRGGDSNVFVKFRFLRGMGYLEKGDEFVFREQGTVGSGMIEELL